MNKGTRGGLLSKSERDYVEGGVEQNVRSDGRERLAPRPIELQVGVVPQANGSCVLKCGGTRVLAGTKVELVSADPPGRGVIICGVNCSMLASAIFEGRAGEDVSAELTRAVNQMLSEGMPPSVYQSLAIGPEGKQCWQLFVDVTVLDYDGTLLDCCTMAIYAALANTFIPQVKILQAAEQGGGPEVEFLDSAEDCVLFDATHVPIYVSLAQIGQRYVTDASALEEACSCARVSLGVNAEGQMCASHKSEGRGLHPAQLSQMLQAAQRIGQLRIEQLKVLVKKSNTVLSPEQLLERPLFF